MLNQNYRVFTRYIQLYLKNIPGLSQLLFIACGRNAKPANAAIGPKNFIPGNSGYNAPTWLIRQIPNGIYPLLMKIGPEFKSMGNSEGIHWHINKNFKIEYVSDTRNRESIPWVKLTNLKTGEVKIFMDEENPLGIKKHLIHLKYVPWIVWIAITGPPICLNQLLIILIMHLFPGCYQRIFLISNKQQWRH